MDPTGGTRLPVDYAWRIASILLRCAYPSQCRRNAVVHGERSRPLQRLPLEAARKLGRSGGLLIAGWSVCVKRQGEAVYPGMT